MAFFAEIARRPPFHVGRAPRPDGYGAQVEHDELEVTVAESVGSTRPQAWLPTGVILHAAERWDGVPGYTG